MIAPALLRDPARMAMKSLHKHPALHFLLLGSLLYLVQSTIVVPSTQSARTNSIQISKTDIDAALQQWIRSTGRFPSEFERQRIIEAQIDDEILVREGIDRDWNHTDSLIQRRLIQNMRFLNEDPSIKDEELLRRAYRLDMDRSDLVVRRRLIARMELELTARERNREIGEDELRSYYEQHQAQFIAPSQIRLTQVFLSRDRRGTRLTHDAEALLHALTAKRVPPEDIDQQGDPLLFPNHLTSMTQDQLAARFGPAFAEGAFQATPGTWVGPIPSSYGAHLVWVHEQIPSKPPDLDSIRTRVISELRRERERQALQSALTVLRADYEVISTMAAGTTPSQ